MGSVLRHPPHGVEVFRVFSSNGSSRYTLSLRRPASTSARISIPVGQNRWCCWGLPQVIPEEYFDHVPGPIAARGITAEVWLTWMRRFESDIGHAMIPVGCMFLSAVLVVPFAILACLDTRIQDAAARFTEDFNSEVLLPAGMYCKIQRGVFRNGKNVHDSCHQSYLTLNDP